MLVAAQCVLDPGDEVLGFDPMYVTYMDALEARGARLIILPLFAEDGFLPDPDRTRSNRLPENQGNHAQHAEQSDWRGVSA